MSEISFHFDDKLYKGIKGEPMAAALLRSGLLSITNSTYHDRPRGMIGLGVEEPNALGSVGIRHKGINAARYCH